MRIRPAVTLSVVLAAWRRQCAYGSSCACLSEWVHHQPGLDNAQVFTVGSGDVTVDETLLRSDTIKGTVTDATEPIVRNARTSAAALSHDDCGHLGRSARRLLAAQPKAARCGTEARRLEDLGQRCVENPGAVRALHCEPTE